MEVLEKEESNSVIKKIYTSLAVGTIFFIPTCFVSIFVAMVIYDAKWTELEAHL